MHIAILSVRGPDYHPNRRLLEAASAGGHTATLTHTRTCLAQVGKGLPRVLSLEGAPLPDLLLPRIGATINAYALAVVRHFEASGVHAVNTSGAITLARNKLLTLQTLASMGLEVPESYLVITREGFLEALDRLGGYPVVIKTLSGRQGGGVILVRSAATAGFLLENAMDRVRGLLVQRFIPPEGRRDLKVFVLGDRVLGALELTPLEGDFRSNVHLTGRGLAISLPPTLEDLALGAAKALGLEIAGVDLLLEDGGGPQIIEVNTSPGFRGLEAASGLDVASEIIHYVAAKGASA